MTLEFTTIYDVRNQGPGFGQLAQLKTSKILYPQVENMKDVKLLTKFQSPSRALYVFVLDIQCGRF